MRHPQHQQHRASATSALAVRPPARSMLSPRSTPLSSGAIGGAVVGAVVGALLLTLCLWPFVVRARRRRLPRHGTDGDPGLAEMGQGPGHPIFTSHVGDLDDSSYKRTSGSAPETGTVLDLQQTTESAQKPHPTLQQVVPAQHGLPLPGSSPTSPASGTDPPFPVDGTDASYLPATAPAPSPSPAEAPSKPPYGSGHAVGREITRKSSASDSYGPPSRELTGITSVGITEEPESFDHPSSSPEPSRFPHLRDSLRSFLHRRHSSHRRRESQRSTLAGGTDGTRSPSVITNDVFSQVPTDPAPSGLEIDIETPGLAWDYYHDPTLGIEASDSYPQSTPTSPSAAVIPPTYGPASAAAGPFLPAGQVPLTGAAVASSMARPVTEEPDSVLRDSKTTLTPATSGGQNTFLQGKSYPTPVLRTDSLPPPTIVADLPSPPFLQYNIGPSGNPMEMMRPTNPDESAYRLNYEMRMIENSPPPPPPMAPDPISFMPTPVDAITFTWPDDHQSAPYQSSYHPPYHAPVPAIPEPGVQISEEPVVYYGTDSLTTPDYSTPPASTGRSAESTPETRLTSSSPSPSPPAEVEATISGQLVPSSGLSPGLSSTTMSGLSPSSGLSPTPSRGRTPGPSPGHSPGRSPARPPGGFVCEVCGAVKSSYHQFNHHRRYHDRPWQCKQPGCERSFGTITHLKRHINDKHFKTRKFYCTQPNCSYSRQGGKSFPRKDNWKRHMLNKHHIDPKDMTDEEVLADVAMDGT
ncbi:uncharacterized protein B0T15DRAFT_51412 [Chaetomium strumarium]|uniref:C2H2-type domain-containing protein n=1 Tax=Chaetomium strumarium TaxID=1170767 RepID=A0AAJ0M6L8_9PEZI|nr:hypothetical protein B0T15DRAFT_51412 [Chaetomium strumarium]